MANRMQLDRRKDSVPWTWEPLVGALVLYVFVVLVAAQVARGLGYLLAGDGWRWPTQDAQITSAFAIFTGNSSAGLPGRAIPVIGHPLMMSSLIVVEVVITAVLTMLLLEAFRRWGSARMYGMASRADAQQILGVARLRRQARVIRPDIYRRRGSSPALTVTREDGSIRQVAPVLTIRTASSRLEALLSRVLASNPKE